MRILLISPNAPPKNSAESMQVGRYLSGLKKNNRVTLVTTPENRGWVVHDPSLGAGMEDVERLEIRLPFHPQASRLMASHYLKRWMRPDDFSWIVGRASWIVRHLKEPPDIIYSRSLPFSSSLLGKALRQRFCVPWIMHLSDPWLDNPYLHFRGEKDRALEYSCFLEADGISVTTECLLNFYGRKYPEFRKKLFLSPNVMPLNEQVPADEHERGRNERLTLLYTGALYGSRNPRLLLDVLQEICHENPSLYRNMDLTFVGNISEDIRQMIGNAGLPGVSLPGRKSYAEVLKLQASADVMLSFEPDGKNPLMKCFLPSKILDYIHGGKPFIAITPRGSETWQLCEQGYGWAVVPDDGAGLKKLLSYLATRKFMEGTVVPEKVKDLPARYSVESCVENLERRMKSMVENACSHSSLKG